MTGTYHFQKAMNLTFKNEKDTFSLLGNIWNKRSHRRKDQHFEKLKRVLDKLDQENIAISVIK